MSESENGSRLIELRNRLTNIKGDIANELKSSGDIPADTENQKKQIMDLLHEYNNVKDSTQIILGALANMDGVTIKDIHMKYNLPID